MPSRIEITTASNVTKHSVNIESFDLNIGFGLVEVIFVVVLEKKEKRKKKIMVVLYIIDMYQTEKRKNLAYFNAFVLFEAQPFFMKFNEHDLLI